MQNDGVGYGIGSTNNALLGVSSHGDLYSFGVVGHSSNNFTRTGGLLGSEVSGVYWGALGYKNSGSTTFGVYGTNGYSNGTGFKTLTEESGIGGGFFGMIGSISKGSVVGQINSGELFSNYNIGDVYSSGKQIDLVESRDNMIPMYKSTATEVTVYKKGKIKLKNGKAIVKFDESYASLLGDSPVVTLSPMGKSNGVFIVSVDKKGFVIEEFNKGKSNIEVGWLAAGDRIDANTTEVPSFIKEKSFDSSLKKVLMSDANTSQNAEGMYWNGKSLILKTKRID